VLNVEYLLQNLRPTEMCRPWRSWIRASQYIYESNQQDATVWVDLLLLVSSTCFGRCFRPSSGALDRIYSIWLCSPNLLLGGALDELESSYINIIANI